MRPSVERRVPHSGDGLGAAVALARGSAEPHVLYENRGAVCWAEGELAVITVDGFDGLAAVGGALRDLGAPRAYGWASFELAHGGRGPLAYFAVPRNEIRFVEGAAALRSADESTLDLLEKRLADVTVTEPSGERVEVDIETYDAAGYREAVAEAVSAIRSGQLEKVILSRTVPVQEEIDFPSTYLAGRRGNDPARSFLLRLGGWEAAGFSPEIVVRVSADGEVATQPLAGTRAFDNSVFDVARREELYRDAKEVFEHAISVRLSAAELATVCAPGTVRVTDFMSVKERGSVQHLASDVVGRLADGRTPWDAFAALFPAVTASGIPKAEACDMIRRTETGDRGLYSGAVLTVDADGAIDAALVLRSVYRRGGRTWLRAGAGIVAQSTPERELEETVEKLRSVSRFLVPSCA
ncbi:salicylate synthase [Lentzea alba]|uniref:salicylate synthase n=1 Tax=Lentzea alba TaxID=2714351 RepID=UPI0039BF06D1